MSNETLMSIELQEVLRFQMEVIGFPVPQAPRLLPQDRKDWARTVILEELDEFLDAETIEDQGDALIDLIYFAHGRLIEMGITPGKWFNEVQRANMDKQRGEKSTRTGSAGYDAVKPEGWRGPDFSELVKYPMAPKTFPKIIVMGYAGHGKDTACNILAQHLGMAFKNTSLFAAEQVISQSEFFRNSVYRSVMDAYDDRSNYRATWFDLIETYNQDNPARLASELFAISDLYCGMRSAMELQGCRDQNLVDLVIWIDASDRLPPEDISSCTVTPEMADVRVRNNQGLVELNNRLIHTIDAFMAGRAS